jgi:lipopolysaccharide biosynthesis glycosyltransferase
MMPSIWIGFDPRESAAFAVARSSARKHLTAPIPIRGLVLADLCRRGLYTRPTEIKVGTWRGTDGKAWASSEPLLWDVISQFTMATEFAISRFLVPHLAREGWALFMDCDVLIRANLTRLFEYAATQSQYAVLVVKHNYDPKHERKMDGQVQSAYSRKNWSSICFFNCDHPANRKLTPQLVNSLPGRDLHRFCWLEDGDIGELGVDWNYLVGEYNGAIDPKLVHFTNGGPWMHGYEHVQFADEWRAAHCEWAS